MDNLAEIKTDAKQFLAEKFALSKLIGNNQLFVEAIRRAVKIAQISAPVLLLGETGTGKELFARAIHHLSSRSNEPYIAVNCAAIPFELFENELFGHVKGAYTDARQQQKGYIAEAEGGTLFLDEINSLHPTVQVKLLRFLQDQEYKPLGESKPVKADVRIIAASNMNLLNPNVNTDFRKDLLYRLDVFSIRIPPLRDRRNDIPELVNHFLEKYCQKYNLPKKIIAKTAMSKLMAYDWPGNIRELENAIHKCVVLSAESVIQENQIEIPIKYEIIDRNKKSTSFSKIKTELINNFERNYITNLLFDCDGNISKAVKLARMDRKNFYRLMKKYKINREEICRH